MAKRLPRWYGKLSDQRILEVLTILAERIIPKTELIYTSTFELLVAVMLSAQATDRSVNVATAGLFAAANTPQRIVALGVAGIEPFLKRINYYKTKARNLVAASQQLIDRHGGEVPNDREGLEALPGVGRKTASVILNTAFRHPIIAVDTHIHRVANRLGIAKSTTPAQTEGVLAARIPAQYHLDAHHYFILHGRYCCMARRPACWRCPVSAQCLFPTKSPAPAIPAGD